MLRNILSYYDIQDNRKKKVLFLVIGLVLLTTGFFILKYVNVENAVIKKLLAGIVSIASMYFIIPILFLSYMTPVYSFRNGIINVILGFILIWTSFVLYIYFDKTLIITIVSIIMCLSGMLISGMVINTNTMILIYINGILNYVFSRIFIILYTVELYLNFLNNF